MKVLFFLLILTSVGCNSQSIKTSVIDKNAKPVINSFFNSLKTNAAESLTQLLASNPNINLNDSATLNLKINFLFINEAAGPYMGNRLLKKRYLGDDIAVYSYLVKYERKFYRFLFMFYNNGKNVKLYKFLFDDSVDAELEESLKFYLNN
jgi:hypothetical protein